MYALDMSLVMRFLVELGTGIISCVAAAHWDRIFQAWLLYCTVHKPVNITNVPATKKRLDALFKEIHVCDGQRLDSNIVEKWRRIFNIVSE